MPKNQKVKSGKEEKNSQNGQAVHIDPASYNKMLKGFQLKSIRARKLSAELRDFSASLRDLTIKVEQATSAKISDKTQVQFDVNYSLTARGKNRKISIKIAAEYVLNFEALNGVNEAFCDKYNESSLHLNVWPFFREFVHSSTSRMHIPPLTLPLLKGPGVSSTKTERKRL